MWRKAVFLPPPPPPPPPSPSPPPPPLNPPSVTPKGQQSFPYKGQRKREEVEE